MGMRFQRRVTIAPGVRVNLGMRGASLSMGPRGASVSVGRRGVYSNVGIPGTGLSHRQKLGSFGNSGHSASAARALAQEEKRLERTRLALEARFEIDDKGKVHVLSETGELLTGAARTEFWKTRASEVTQALSALLEEEETRLLGVLEVGQQDLSNEVPTYTPKPFSEPEPQPPGDIQDPTEPTPPKKRFLFLAPSDDTIAAYESEHTQWTRNKLASAQRFEAELEAYNKAHAAWEAKARAHDREQQHWSKNYLELVSKNPGFMGDALENALADYPWPCETHACFEIEGLGDHVRLDADMPQLEQLPQETARLAASGRALVFKKIPKKELQNLYTSYVLSSVYKLCELTFRTLPKAKTVTISAFTQRDDAAGRLQDTYILSTVINREDWMRDCAQSQQSIDAISQFIGSQNTRVDLPKLREIEPF